MAGDYYSRDDARNAKLDADSLATFINQPGTVVTRTGATYQTLPELVDYVTGLAVISGMADGTVSSPGVDFINDPDTGIYRDVSGNFSFAFGGVQVGYFNGSGLTLPAAPLAVNEGGTGQRTVAGLAQALQSEPTLNYIHTQGSASASWVISHNLGRYPSVQVYDSANNLIMVEVSHGSLVQTTITVNPATSGIAILS